MTAKKRRKKPIRKQRPLPALGFSVQDLWDGRKVSRVVREQVKRFNPSGQLEEGGTPSGE
jgi:hypothetical protein